MIKVTCSECNRTKFKSPSKVNARNYCDRTCYGKTRNKELSRKGKIHRFKKGRPEMRQRLEALKKNSGESNYAWKGEEVSYRGLHQWVRRKKGKPVKCIECRKKSTKPRVIQWANFDGKYRRNIDDFIALCCSCHKRHDINLKYL